jgi:hypothetical protein
MTYPMRAEALGIIGSDSGGAHLGTVKVVRSVSVWYSKSAFQQKIVDYADLVKGNQGAMPCFWVLVVSGDHQIINIWIEGIAGTARRGGARSP